MTTNPRCENWPGGMGLMAVAVPMKNTHHQEMTELLIGRSLDWLNFLERHRERRTRRLNCFTPMGLTPIPAARWTATW